MSDDRQHRKIKTVLNPERQSLLPGLGCSVVLHGGAILTAVLFSALSTNCGARAPVIDVDRAMEVSVVARSELNVPDRAARAPVPRGAVNERPDTPTPVEESDLVFEKDDPDPTEGTADLEREQLMAELQRQKMLEDLMAPTGPVDRDATSPDGHADLTLNPGGVNRADPEYAAYIAKLVRLFQQHFKPLGAVTEGRPDLVCSVFITVDPATGRVRSWEIVKSSGIDSYDAAAERAVAQVGTIPLPPERFRADVADGYTINLRPQ